MKIDLGTHSLNVIDEGPRDGAPLVLLHALGTGAHLWEDMIEHLPPGLRIIRPDMRGHRDSTAPEGAYKMGSLVRDVERVLDQLEVRDAVVVGLSIGGMVAQGLAVKRLDIVRGLVLANTSARVGIASQWDKQIEEVRAKGTGGMTSRTIEAWFTKDWHLTGKTEPWRKSLASLPDEVVIGYMEAVKTTDFYTPTSGLRLPTLGLASLEDKIIPPDMTRETVELIPGSKVEIIRKSGHLSPVDQPISFAMSLVQFLKDIGHIAQDAEI
ncbi:alpha/beta fold hydrolase [Cognatishimia sp. D5M38]|uniref:Alpha/beta fold hydrolase n=1 Tax=Cognatishimia coralii TaxID=3083254 RepID=A0ABU8QFC3_9RHOB